MALTDYNIISTNSRESLITQVKAAAAGGWLPQGQPFTTDNSFNQAMVKGDVAGGPGSGTDYELPEAGVATLGGVLQGAGIDDATDATDVITQLNALIASLVASGAIAAAV